MSISTSVSIGTSTSNHENGIALGQTFFPSTLVLKSLTRSLLRDKSLKALLVLSDTIFQSLLVPNSHGQSHCCSDLTSQQRLTEDSILLAKPSSFDFCRIRASDFAPDNVIIP
ncbi:Afamin [Manis pentadactyla]|nr:Afamin [Manis pentadactyla]